MHCVKDNALKGTHGYKISVHLCKVEIGYVVINKISLIWTSRLNILKTVPNNQMPRWIYTSVWMVDCIAWNPTGKQVKPIGIYREWRILEAAALQWIPKQVEAKPVLWEWRETVSNKASGDFRMGQHTDEAPVFLHYPIIEAKRSAERHGKNSRP